MRCLGASSARLDSGLDQGWTPQANDERLAYIYDTDRINSSRPASPCFAVMEVV